MLVLDEAVLTEGKVRRDRAVRDDVRKTSVEDVNGICVDAEEPTLVAKDSLRILGLQQEQRSKLWTAQCGVEDGSFDLEVIRRRRVRTTSEASTSRMHDKDGGCRGRQGSSCTGRRIQAAS